MEDLKISLSNYIRQAKTALDANDNARARECLLRSAECALLLAKNSGGKSEKQYLSQYESLKVMINNLNRRMEQGVGANAAPVKTFQSGTVNDGGTVKDGKAFTKPAKTDSLSPQRLCDYIGQPQAVTAVRDLITAARLKNSAMPHLILYGSHGLGKTTFSRIIANELGVGFTEVNVSKMNSAEMIAILKKLKPRDIVFIDEIHTLPIIVAESVLYSAMQDGRITFTEGKGKFARTQVLTLPPFTLIGATTEVGKLAKPFTQRAIQIRLEEYSDEVLGGIITNSFYKLGMKISSENGLYIARRCRNNPRIANNTVRRISDKALVRYAAINNLRSDGAFGSPDAVRKLNIEVTQKLIEEFFTENGIDEYGLENGDRELLKIIITRYGGGPVGIDTLARVMNESNNVISQKYEAYLIKKGFMRIDRDGRVVMPAAYRALGLPVPPEAEEKAKTSDVGDERGERKSRFEDRKVIACRVPDEIKCKNVEDLIEYPPEAGVITKTLDELFPDIEKEYDGETKHLCKLEIDFDDFKRCITCDSFLESRFAICMATVGYLKDLKAQTLEIPYVSQELANRRYFPDFIIKDYKGRIAIIEMKNFDMLSYHLNIDKYEMLKNYCISRGYGYAEIAKANNAERYVSAEQIKRAPVNVKLEEYIFKTIEENGRATGEGMFGEKDFRRYIAENGATDRAEIYTILLNNRKLKNTDRAGGDFRIIFE